MSLEKKFPELKKKFPENFIYLFDSKEELNFTGRLATEVLSLRKIKQMLLEENNQLRDKLTSRPQMTGAEVY